MQGIYKLKNGEKIAVFLCRDILENNMCRSKTHYNKVLPSGYHSQKSSELNIKKDYQNSKLYFVINGEKIYFEDFEFTPAAELVEKISNRADKNAVRQDEILATLIKDGDNIEVVFSLDEKEIILPDFLMALINPDNKKEVLCVFSEKRYKKYEWAYKIGVEAKDPLIRMFCYPGGTYYIEDFCSLVMEGHIKLINKGTYIEPEKEKVSQTLIKKK